MQRFLDLFIYINCSTCFRWFLHPSSWMRWNVSSISSTTAAGSSIGLTIPDAVCTVLCSWWWAEEPPENVEQFVEINRSRKRCILLVVLSRYTCDARTYKRQISPSLLHVSVRWARIEDLRSISSTTAAGSSIDLTIPDAVCTVLCSWWWAEEPPETCRAIYINK